MKFHISIKRKNQIIFTDTLQRIQFKFLSNRESLIKTEYIDKIENNIPSILILIKIQQLALWFNNDKSDDIKITKTKTKYTND